MKKITVGVIGSGYAAYLHWRGYKNISGYEIKLKSIVDIDKEKAIIAKEKFGFENAFQDYRKILTDPEIDIIDICTPPKTHVKIAKEALKSNKHVICEKPLTGFFESDLNNKLAGNVEKRKMYKKVLEEMEELKKHVYSSSKKFMYAENIIYSPSIQKAAELIIKKKSKILFMQGEESLKGSSSPVAGLWKETGGGSLLRIGSHPIGGILWLKRAQSQARDENVYVDSIIADTGQIYETLKKEEKKHFTCNPIDVEDIATLTITFSDKTKALITAADICLGGTRNYINIYTNDSSFRCNMTPTDSMETYFLDEERIEDIEIAEMLPTKIGWNKAFISDEILRGYTNQFQDFIDSVAKDKEPISNFDIAYDITKIIYAAYISSEEGKRIYLNTI
ncbi:MAG: Gfo/Idh/MocA family oxidoreductase [Bacillota bacterium]|nr:Gfo/Idh/MocA family oxidoreductase [Bacillota bacterium]